MYPQIGSQNAFAPSAQGASFGQHAAQLGPPPRTLSPALRAWATQRFATRVRWVLLAIIGLANAIGGVVFIVISLTAQSALAPVTGQINDAQAQAQAQMQQMSQLQGLSPDQRARIVQAQQQMRQMPSDPVGSVTGTFLYVGIAWIVFDVLLLAGLVAFFRGRGASKGRTLITLLEQGQVMQTSVQHNQVDYSVRINGAPRRIIGLVFQEAPPLTLTMFDQNFANLFPPGAMIEVLRHPSISDMVFPTSSVPAL